MDKLSLKDAIEYVNRVAQDGTNVAVCWKFCERRNRSSFSFDGEHFIECLKVVIEKISTSKVKKSGLTEGKVRRGGIKPHPSTPRPNIKPVGQKPVKRSITYNDRVVGPS